MITTYAALVTDENVDDIIKRVAEWHLNVEYLKDNLKCVTEFGDSPFYGILSINGRTAQATFTEMDEDDFAANWRFAAGVYLPHFREVDLIK